MPDSGIGFGGFLLGLGVGWYLFQYIDLGFDVFSYLLILIGVGMVLSGLLSKGRRRHPLSGIYGSFIGGLFLSAILTQGFGIIFDITNEFGNFSGDYKATESFTVISPVTSEMIALNIDSLNGGIEVSSWSGDAVKFDIEVKAKGDTISNAEDNLAVFDYDLNSKLSGDVQQMSLSFPIPTSEWIKYAVIIDVYVPSSLSADYDLRTTNGGITLIDLTGGSFFIDTINGAILLSDVEAELIKADTTNGAIEGTITTSESSLSTINGAIKIELTKTSGTHTFSTTNGGIDLNLPAGLDVGYNVNLDTSIGSVNVNLPNIDYSVDRTRTKIGETSEYLEKLVQIVISADTNIGGIKLN